ncbi:hypothetical protein SDC9_92943 [bioreactor metagenome]|uniref:Uncharacterized protein n=1 Tax=bioreactor metagenome TaxID=1076179 RepID=A0A644ZZ59_9ZZZZ
MAKTTVKDCLPFDVVTLLLSALGTINVVQNHVGVGNNFIQKLVYMPGVLICRLSVTSPVRLCTELGIGFCINKVFAKEVHIQHIVLVTHLGSIVPLVVHYPVHTIDCHHG